MSVENKALAALPGFEPLSACAGIAFVKRGFPYVASHQLAEALTKLAKKRAGEVAGKRVPSAISFFRMQGSVVRGEEDLVKRELTARDQHSLSLFAYGLQATAGLPTIDALRELVSALHDPQIARGAVRELVTIIQDAPEDARPAWDRFVEVHGALGQGQRSERGREALGRVRAALSALGALPDRPWLVPLVKREKPGTPLFDALSLAAVEGYRGAARHLRREQEAEL